MPPEAPEMLLEVEGLDVGELPLGQRVRVGEEPPDEGRLPVVDVPDDHQP